MRESFGFTPARFAAQRRCSKRGAHCSVVPMSDSTDHRRLPMKAGSIARCLSALAIAALSMVGVASAADVHVMISAGFYGVYAELAPAFERTSGHHLVTVRG